MLQSECAYFAVKFSKDMKRIVKIIFGITLLALLYAFTPIKNTSLTSFTNVSLNNIEALSSGEPAGTLCYGEGTVDCLQYKSEFKVVLLK